MNKTFVDKPNNLILSALWIFLLTSILHFAYSFTRFFPLSFISSVNESVWEHTKITFFAALFYDIFLYFRYFKGCNNFIFSLFPSLASIIITIPFLFYGYTGILGFNILIIDLAIAYVAALISQYILIHFCKSKKDYSSLKTFSIIMVIAMVIMFFLFTWYPPKLPLFIEKG